MSGSWPPPESRQPQPGNWPPPQARQQPSYAPMQGQPAYYYPPHQNPDDKALEWLLPINRSGLAIAAGYVGLLTFPILVTSPVAVLLGILALGDIKRHPTKGGKGRAWFAIIYGGMGTLVLLMVLAFTPFMMLAFDGG